MGFGSSRSNLEQYFCTAKSFNKEKECDPHFTIDSRDANGNIGPFAAHPRDPAISGYIYRIAHKTYEFERAKHYVAIVTLVEDGKSMKVEFDMGAAIGRAFVNRMLSITGEEKMLFIRLYKQKSKVDDKFYANVWCGTSEDKLDAIPWKYENKDLEPLVILMDDPDRPGEKRKVYHKVVEKLWAEYLVLEEKFNLILKDSPTLKKVLSAGVPKGVSVAEVESELQQEFDAQPPPDQMEPAKRGEDTSDDLPF